MTENKEMKKITISENSTKEEVAEYFSKEHQINEEAKNQMLKEDISGDVLMQLKEEDYKLLSFKFGSKVKVKNFIKDNKDKFKEKEKNEEITIKSKPKDVKSFFENSLNFKGELNNMNGKTLLEMDEEGMKKLGLNLGQRKRLTSYISYFKTLKVKEIVVTSQSSKEEVAEFLRNELDFSESTISELELDGESLFLLEEEDLDEEESLQPEEKEKLKQYILENRAKDKKEPEITFSKNSTVDEVIEFLNQKFGIKKEKIKELGLDGESLLLMEEGELDDLEPTPEQKEKLIEFLKEEKSKI